jgi:transcription initiation factor TFIID subunit TAF12
VVARRSVFASVSVHSHHTLIQPKFLNSSLQKRRTKIAKKKGGKKVAVKKQIGKKGGPKQPQGGVKQQQQQTGGKQQQQQAGIKQQGIMKKKDPSQAIRQVAAVGGSNQQHQANAAGVEVPNTVSEYNHDEEMPGITVSQTMIHAF